MAYEVAKEAESIISNTNDDKGSQINEKQQSYKDAIPLYEEAIMLGRKPAISLYELKQQQAEEETSAVIIDDDRDSLKWLIDLYCKSASIKLEIEDVDGARGDAWAACVFSQNTYLPALQCMKKVCESSNDLVGEIMALKQILDLMPKEPSSEKENVTTSSMITTEEKEDMLKRLQILETKLQKDNP